MYLAKDIRIQKGAFNGRAVEARTEDSQTGGMFVLTMEGCPLEQLFKVLDGGTSDMVGDVGGVCVWTIGFGLGHGFGALEWMGDR